MPFSSTERSVMLAVRGVGETVIARLEQLGYSSLAELKTANAPDITRQIALQMGSTCWQNSPQAKTAIQSLIDLAQMD
jgi:hypothetical protein